MLLEPIIIAIINLLNLQVVPDKVFFKLCLKVLMLLHFFVDSGNLFHFEGPKKESEFWPAVVLRNGCFNLR